MRKGFLFMMCVVFLSLTLSVPSFALINGLVGAWTFDDDSGGKVKDVSGNGFDGELAGNAKIDKAGKFGSAVSTDGTEAYVMIPDNDAFEFNGDFTIACWIQNDTPPTDNSSFVTKGYHKTAAAGGDAKPWYLVYFLKTGTVDFFLRDTNAVNSRAVGATLVNDGKWHHILGMKDGAEVKIYIDGKEDGVAAAVDAVYGKNDLPLVFMVHYDRWFKGMIDEVAVFNKALSKQEIELTMGGLSKNILAVSPKSKLTSTWGSLKSN